MEFEREEASYAASARDCLLSDFLSQPTSVRPRSTGEPLRLREHVSLTPPYDQFQRPHVQPEGPHSSCSATHDGHQKRPESLPRRSSSFTSISSGKSEKMEHDPFYLPPSRRIHGNRNRIDRRTSSPGSSFARSGSESLSLSEELSRCPSSVKSDDDVPSRASKRGSSRRIGLHRLSRVLGIDSNDNKSCEQSEDSDFFARDDYVGFTSDQGSRSRRHSYFSRLSKQQKL